MGRHLAVAAFLFDGRHEKGNEKKKTETFSRQTTNEQKTTGKK